uniref:RWD domain-containing protein 2B n=1 Tax=Auxenochlorella protothecoides TaxID=3075 RepID=A0A1D2A3C9_AUXPR
MNSCSEAAEDLLALQACYPEAGALVLTPAEEQALVLQSKTGLAGELGATLHIPDVLASGEPISLNISLPIAYPREGPSLTVHSAAPRDVTAELQAVVKTTAEASQGLPCLLACVAALVAAAQDLQSSTEQQKDENPVEADARSVKAPESPDPMCCRLFWFHHIKSLTKRKVIVQEAKNLEIGGFSKPGFPGVIVAEGSLAALEGYTATLRALRWSAMAVRGEEAGGLTRRLPLPLREVAGEGMGELASLCRGAGVEALFLSALKLPTV